MRGDGTPGLDSGHRLIPGSQGHGLPESGCLVRANHGCLFIDHVKYSRREHLHAWLRLAARQRLVLIDARQFCCRDCRDICCVLGGKGEWAALALGEPRATSCSPGSAVSRSLLGL